MASNRPLHGDLTVTGQDQASLYAWMANITDLVNELQADHATFRTNSAELKTALNAVIVGAAATDALTQIAAVTDVATSAPASLSNSTALTLLRS